MALHEIDPRTFLGPLTWLVLVRQAPIYVRENPNERAWLSFILERETELIIGQELALDATPATALKLVQAALIRPLAGPRRKPARIIVERQDLGTALVAKLGIHVEVSDRPLPEGDQFLAGMKRFLDGAGAAISDRDEDEEAQHATYFEGNLPPALIKDLITKASALGKLRPWDVCSDDLIRLDIPEMGVKEAGVCVIGQMGESLGILVYRSREDYLVQVGRGERLANQPEFSPEAATPGIPILSLNFDPPGEVPESMRKEAAAMGLKAGRTTLYPHVLCVDPDGVRRPTAERDVRLILAVTAALTEGLRRFGRRLDDPASWPICMESRVPGLGTVRLVMPFDAGVFFEGEPRRARPEEKAARSGKMRDEETMAEAMTLLLAAAETTFKDAAREIDRALKKEDGDTLAAPWAFFHRAPKGLSVTVAEALLRSGLGSRKARKWMEAQGRSWISAWHIADSSNDQFSCRDLITGEFRVFVHADPRTRGRLAQGDVFLGRIVDFAEGPSIFGAGAYTLPLRSANAVVESVRRALKAAEVTPEMLRGHHGGLVVQREWNKVTSARRV
jgi:hypothetical protein